MWLKFNIVVTQPLKVKRINTSSVGGLFISPLPLPSLYANIAIKHDLVGMHSVNQSSTQAAAGQHVAGSHGSLHLVRVFPRATC